MADHKETLKKLKEDLARASKREVQLKTVGAVLAGLMALLVFMAIIGDPLGILAFLGLRSAERRGAYGDCSDPANRYSKICDRSENKSKKQWKNLQKTRGKNAPFSLFGN